MSAFTIARREWRAAFDSPVAYVILAVLPAIAAAFFMLVGSFFAVGIASMRDFFGFMPWLLVFVTPAITMRSWSEERRAGTDELLFSYPFRNAQLVLGKFIAAWGILALSLVATVAVPLTVAWLGPLDPGPVISGYLGALLLGGACTAVGLFLSACTRNQVVAWMLTVAVLIAWNLLSVAATATAIPAVIGKALLAADFGVHYASIARGVVDLRDVAFYVVVTVFFLVLNALALERRRWT